MSDTEIIQLAKRFRKALDDAVEWGVFGDELPFVNFPSGCCDDVCDIFGELLLENCISVTKVFGIYRYNDWDKKYSHVWLEIDDRLVIDLTGDQYKDDPIMLNFNDPCYIGKSNSLHQLFLNKELKRRPFHGIYNYDEDVRKRLGRLYRNIASFM